MKRRNFLLGAGSMAAGGSALIGTGAFTSVSADRTAQVAVADDIDAFLELGPCSDDSGNERPNGHYVQLENGVLTLDLTSDNPTSAGGQGVNADATTRFDNVFRIRNQGTQSVGVWLDIAEAAQTPGDDPRIEFYREDDPSSEIVEDGSNLNAKCLQPGEGICVGIIIRTQGLDSGADETDLFDTSTTPGSNGEAMVVNADAEVACSTSGGDAPSIPSDGLIGHWPLDSVEDGTAEDLSGGNYDGDIQAGVSATAGQIDGAADFGGTNNYITIPGDFNRDTATTVSFWADTTPGTNEEFASAFSSSDDSTIHNTFQIDVSGDGSWRVNGEFAPQPIGPVSESGTFDHIVVTIDGGTIKGYRNGSGPVTTFSGPFDTNSPYNIGRFENAAIGANRNKNRPFEGIVDDVRVYDRVLTETEIQDLYDGG